MRRTHAPMNLHTIYIVRHGIAEDYASSGRDADRRLTASGIEKTRLAAAGLRRIDTDPQLVLTSPLRRAEETARMIAEALGDVPVRVTTALAPGGAFPAIIGEATAPPRPSAVCVVGHQPDLGMFASWLLTGDAHRVVMPFRKAGAARIDVTGTPAEIRGVLAWFLPPAHLRSLA